MNKYFKAYWIPLCVFFIGFLFCFDNSTGGMKFSYTSPSTTSIANQTKIQEMLSQVRDQDAIPVIIGLTLPEMKYDNEITYQEIINHTQQIFIDSFSSYKTNTLHLYTYIPYLSFTTDQSGIISLVNHPMVNSIELDKSMQPSLSSTVDIIGGTTAHSWGYTGEGTKVAVLDSGINSAFNAFLSGKVSQEACYSNANGNGISVCPDNSIESEAANSGDSCNGANSLGKFGITLDSCWHGTHIAGIIAGKDEANNLYGVAPDSQLISIQVFTYVNGAIRAYQSDVNKALEHVLSLYDAGDHSIAAVNLSLEYYDSSNKRYTSQSTCDTDWSSTKALIDELATRNIPVIVASGDSGFTTGMKAPACISSAVSVGASTDSDTITSFTNSASFLDLVAPGKNIYSSWAAGFGTASGTSQAAAHVSGAWALLKDKDSNITYDEGLSALKSTAKKITDTRNNLKLKRIQIDKALNELGPRAATLTSPIGGVKFTDRTPTFTWQPVTDATSYKIKIIQKANSTTIYENWFTASEVGCESASPCTWTPTTNLGLGEMEWMILGRDVDLVEGVWSSKGAFFIQIEPPSLISPTGSDTLFRPTYQWQPVDGAEKYYLYVYKNGTTAPEIKVWLTEAEYTCIDDVCSSQPDIYLSGGNYQWWLRSYNTYSGKSAWSEPLAFSTQLPPDTPTIVSPADSESVTTFKPTYTWTKMDRATKYLLYVVHTNGTVYLKTWYYEDDLTCDDTYCSITPSVSLVGGTYQFWIRSGNPQGKSAWSEPVSFSTPQKPAPVVLTSPSGEIQPTGSIDDWQPTLIWEPSEWATKYQLKIINITTNVVFLNINLTTAQVNCASGELTCTYDFASFGKTLGAGKYRWKVAAKNPAGTSKWSDYLDFVPPTKPAKVTLDSPEGNLKTWQPTYLWSRSTRAIKYKLEIYLAKDLSVVFSEWLLPETLGCTIDGNYLCEYTPEMTLNKKSYKWRVQAYNPSGKIWSDYMQFSAPGFPATPVLINPIGGITTSDNIPWYTWKAVKATSYTLQVTKIEDGTIVLERDYTAETLGCVIGVSDTCTIHPELFLEEGKEYSWVVRGINDAGTGYWSEPGIFISGEAVE